MQYIKKLWFHAPILCSILVATSAAAEPLLVGLRGAPWTVAGVGDFDGDGDDDLLWRYLGADLTGSLSGQDLSGQNLIEFFENARIVEPAVINQVPDLDWQVIGVGDLTGDGRSDILWRNRTNYNLAAYRMDGAVASYEPLGIGLGDGWQPVGVADLDGDGDDDLLWRCPPQAPCGFSGENRAYLMAYDAATGLTFDDTHVSTVDGQPWQPVAIDDLDGDGDADILWRRDYENGDGSTSMVVHYLSWSPTGGFSITGGSFASGGPSLAWANAGAVDLQGDGRSDVVFRNLTNGKVWRHQYDGTTIAFSQRVPPRLFEDTSFSLAGFGDLDRDGNHDIIWRKKATGETWVSRTRSFRAVNFNPYTRRLNGTGVHWVRFINTDPTVAEDIRLELRAIKEKTGLTQVKFQFGVGLNLDFPVPTTEQLDNVVTFLNIVGEEGMQATFNIGNHCWVPNASLYPDDQTADFQHIGGFNRGECFSHVPQTHIDVCSVSPDCAEAACQKIFWDMPKCEENYLDESVQYYTTILNYLEANVIDYRRVILFVIPNGDPLSQLPAEPAVYRDNFFGTHGDEVSLYLQTIMTTIKAQTDIPVGHKFWLQGRQNGLVQYEQLDNFRQAIGPLFPAFDYYDFTTHLYMDPDEILSRLDPSGNPATASKVALTDFKARWFSQPDGEYSLLPMEELMACVMDEVDEHDFVGWWFQSYRDEDRTPPPLGLREFAAPIGPDPSGAASTWKEPSVDVVAKDQGQVAAPPFPICGHPMPVTFGDF